MHSLCRVAIVVGASQYVLSVCKVDGNSIASVGTSYKLFIIFNSTQDVVSAL